MVQTLVETDKIDTFRADERGRIYLGSEYKEKDVRVVVLTDPEDKEE